MLFGFKLTSTRVYTITAGEGIIIMPISSALNPLIATIVVFYPHARRSRGGGISVASMKAQKGHYLLI